MMYDRHTSSNSLASELSRLNAEKIFEGSKFVESLSKQDILSLRREFRQNLEKHHKKCQVTGMMYGCIASHIKPLAYCVNKEECVDPANGLYLCKTIDEVFDKGWISFDDDGVLLVSKVFEFNYRNDIKQRVPKQWLSGGSRLCFSEDGAIASRQRSYLRYHRYNVYKSEDGYRYLDAYTQAEYYDKFKYHREDPHSEKYIQSLERNKFSGRRDRDYAKALRKSRRLETGIVYVAEGN